MHWYLNMHSATVATANATATRRLAASARAAATGSLLVMVLAALLAAPARANTTDYREWAFDVLLDNKAVGSHYFKVQAEGDRLRMETEADMAVKVLFVTVFRYLHRNVEIWEDGCLAQIEASTKVNGKTLGVNGERQGRMFNLDSPAEQARLPECVMSFAYWDPKFLEQSRLLNSQTGEYVPVTVSGPFADEREVRGQPTPAQRYRLRAGDIDLRLWYSMANDWLALESEIRGGRVLSYELR